MKKIFFTVILTLAVLIIACLVYILSGSYNVSQLSKHNGMSQLIISTTLRHSIDKRTKEIKVPSLTDTTMVAEGFSHYSEMCVICHGAPGIDPSEMTEGLYPNPPKFYKSEDMPDPAEAFWIIKYGIKMTSMPAFEPTHTDGNIWAITSFMLNKMNSMSPTDYRNWGKRYSGAETENEK